MNNNTTTNSVAAALEAAGITTPQQAAPTAAQPTAPVVTPALRARRQNIAGVFEASLIPMAGCAVVRLDAENRVVAPVAVAWRIRMGQHHRAAFVTPASLMGQQGDVIMQLDSYQRALFTLTKDEELCGQMLEETTAGGRWAVLDCGRHGAATEKFGTNLNILTPEWRLDETQQGLSRLPHLPISPTAEAVDAMIKASCGGYSAWGLTGAMLSLSGGVDFDSLPRWAQDQPCEATRKSILVHKLHPPDHTVETMLNQSEELLGMTLAAVSRRRYQR